MKLTARESRELFGLIDASLNEYREVLDANYKGAGKPISLATMCGLAVTEPIAKVYYPYRGNGKLARVRHWRNRNPQTLKQVDVGPAIKHFFSDCFANPEYGIMSDLIWDAYRNAHVHLYQPKKIVRLPWIRRPDSFLMAVRWRHNLSLTKLSKDLRAERKERMLHLKFGIAFAKGKKVLRPIFRFSPLIYYLDLLKAVSFLRRRKSNPIINSRLARGYRLMVHAKRLDFSELVNRTSVLKRIRKIIPSNGR